MPAQDGIRFLFDIQDKITAQLIQIEKKVKASTKKIDKAFTGASKSQETSSLKLAAIEQRRVAAAESNATKLIAIEQRRIVAAGKSTERAVALAKRESAARTRASEKSAAAEKRRIAGVEKAHAKSVALLKRQSAAFKQSMTRLASAAAVAFAAVAAKAVGMASGYDLAMRSVQAKTGASGELMDKLSEQAREMGRSTVHSATEAARGQAFLAQAGFDANEVLSALPGTLNLATAGELGLAEAADIASNVLTGFGLSVSEADRVADVLALTAQSTNTNVTQMGGAMKFAAAVAAASGGDFEETAAAIGLLANAGFQGESGGTALRGAMTKLLNPTKQAQKILDELGVSAVTSTGDLKPLHEIIAQFEQAGLTAGDAMQVFGQRAGPGMLALVSQGSDALIDLTGELKNAEGTAQATADTMSGGLWGALKSIQSIVESAYISLGERFGPAIEKVAKNFAKFPAPIQEVVVVVGSLAGAMGGLMLIMPQSFGALVQFPGKLLVLAKSLKGVTAAQWLLNAAMTANPIGIVVAAVALLAGGLYLLFTKTKIGREAFRAYANIAKAVFATAINIARFAIEKLAKWAGIVKKKIGEMIPKWVSKAVEFLGRRVAAVTGEIREFNERMEASAKQTKEAVEVYEDLADVTTTVHRKTKLLPPIFEDTAEAQADAAEAAAELAEEQQAATRAADALTDRLKEQRRLLLGLPTDKAIQDFKDLTRTWNELSKSGEVTAEVTERYTDILLAAAGAGLDLDEAQLALVQSAKAATKAQEAATEAQEAAGKAADALNDRLEDQRRALLGLPTDGVVQSFQDLAQTWEAMDEAERAAAIDNYAAALREAAEAGLELDDSMIEIVESTDDAKKSASGYELALAAVAGQMGDATGQAVALVIAMLEHNKAQKQAAAAGEETAGKFSKARVAAASLSAVLSTLGDDSVEFSWRWRQEMDSISKGFAEGGPMGAAVAGAASLAKAIGSIFGGSKKHKAARNQFAAFHEKVREELRRTEEFALEVQRAIDDGWNRTLAETRAAFIITATAAGVSYDDAFEHYARYREAVKSANFGLMEEIEEMYDEWVKKGEDAAKKLDQLYADVVSAFEDVREAGVETYNEVYNAAIASGVGQEEAAARATQAQIDATADVMAAEGQKYARIAAFEAALAAHRSGNADQMVVEAKAAAAETIAAWGAAVVAVTQADRAATDAMINNGNARTNIEIANTERVTAARAAGRSARKAGRASARSERKAAREAEQAEELAAQEAALAEAQAVIEAALEAETTAREEALAAQQAAADKVFGSVISGYFRAKDAGVSAYETVYDAAIESGKKQSVAIALATQAQIDAKAEVLAAEGDKYAQLHAFEAALAAIRSGNADGAATAAQDAAASSRLAWDTAMTAVGLADDIATQAMQDNSTETSDRAISDAVSTSEGVRGSMDAITEADRATADAIQSSNTETSDRAISESNRMVNGIVAELDKIPTKRTVTIDYHGQQTGDHSSGSNAPGRQHGGPVSAGRPFVVGEGGPELFIPSQSGRIAPHGSSAGGGVDAKAFAQAVADALQDVKLEVDGRQLGRLTIRHQPTAVAELGGRR